MHCKQLEQSVAILGAGQMGIAIAATFLKQLIPVTLFDVSEAAVQSAFERVKAELQLQMKLQNVDNFDAAMSLLTCTSHLHRISEVNYVVETITEKKRAKQRLYQQIAPFLAQGQLLLSNTSTISISELADSVSEPDKFCGFHFFHPVRARSLLEIVRGDATSETTIEQAKNLAVAIEKTPMVVADGPGFLVNRLLNPYLSSALQLLADGETIQRVDRVAEQFGMAMGPFRIMDEIGLDVTLHGGWVLYKAFPERVTPSPILLELIEHGNLGRKTGQGFYCYDSTTLWDAPGRDNDLLNAQLAQKFQQTQSTCFSNDEIIDRLIGEMRREAERVITDGIITSPHDVESAVVLGLGFPKGKW